MSYQVWSVVFGEQPSASKWNILGTNDASFNDGTGIASSAIIAAKIAAGAVTPEKLLSGNGTSWVWQSWTPTISNSGGTVSATINQAKYVKIGKGIYFRLNVTVNSVSANGGLAFTVPETAFASGIFCGAGREDASTGKMTQVLLKSSTTTASIIYYDNAGSTAAAGVNHVINGFYEVA